MKVPGPRAAHEHVQCRQKPLYTCAVFGQKLVGSRSIVTLRVPDPPALQQETVSNPTGMTQRQTTASAPSLQAPHVATSAVGQMPLPLKSTRGHPPAHHVKTDAHTQRRGADLYPASGRSPSSGHRTYPLLLPSLLGLHILKV